MAFTAAEYNVTVAIAEHSVTATGHNVTVTTETQNTL